MIVHTDLLAPRLPTLWVVVAVWFSANVLPDGALAMLLPVFLFVIVHDLGVLVPWQVADGVGDGYRARRWHRGYYAMSASEVILKQLASFAEQAGAQAVTNGLHIARGVIWLVAIRLLYLLVRYVWMTLREIEDPRREAPRWFVVLGCAVVLPLFVFGAHYRLRSVLKDSEIDQLGLGSPVR